jgi:DNA-directed RNA polymerase III subunit RPC8
MFVLYSIKDVIPVEPELLSASYREAVTLKLEAKYVGKVLKDEGVCITIYELEIIESVMPLGSESLDCVVEFSLVLLKPFAGEVMTGKVLRTSREGLFISLEFCEVFVPASSLAHPSS